MKNLLADPARVRGGMLPCLREDMQLWFSERPADLELAKSYCQPCPLRKLCLDGAVARREPHGGWGGEVFARGRITPRGGPPGPPPRCPGRAGSQAVSSPAAIPLMNARHASRFRVRAGPAGFLESRTATMPGRFRATSTQLPSGLLWLLLIQAAPDSPGCMAIAPNCANCSQAILMISSAGRRWLRKAVVAATWIRGRTNGRKHR